MRVLLISANRSRITMPPFPLGLAYVAANVDGSRHVVRVWDSMFPDDCRASLRNEVRAFRPEAVGISVRNVDDQEMRQPQFLLEEARVMVETCREETDAVLIAGGPGFSLFPQAALDYLGVALGIVGEGEYAFNELLNRLDAGEEVSDVPGLVWRDGGQLRVNPPQWIGELDSLARPDHISLDAVSYYESRGTANIPNVIAVQGKRGCDQACIYCSSPSLEGNAIRLRSPESVVNEVEHLRDNGFSRIQFVDSLFTNPRWHAEAICEELLRRGLDVRWGCTLNPGFADPDLLSLMKRAGCALVMIGNESGCTRILRHLRKGFQKGDVERCFSTCEREGLRYNAFLLVGGPGEDRESVEESVELLERHSPQQVTVTVGIRLYPGCELAELANEEGVTSPDADLLAPTFYLAPAVRDWIWDFLEPVMKRNPHWTY